MTRAMGSMGTSRPKKGSGAANNGGRGGGKITTADYKGAQVKLRRLTPEDAAKFMSSLTRVRLVVERMQLQDSDGDGRWDMEINLKVPE